MAQLIIPVTLGAEEQIWRFMTEQSKNEDRLQSPQPLTDFYGEDRHGARHHSKGCRFQNPFIARVIIDTREKGTGEQPVEGLSTFGKNSLTSTGTKEAVRWVRQKSIGLQPKRPSARTCWLQELNSDQTTG
jgi:hypothetical protein